MGKVRANYDNDNALPHSSDIVNNMTRLVEHLSGFDITKLMEMSAREAAEKSKTYQHETLLGWIDEHLDMGSRVLSYLYYLLRQFIELTEQEREARRKNAKLVSR